MDAKIKIIKGLLKSGIITPEKLSYLKRKLAKQSKLPLPSNVELLESYHKLMEEKMMKKSPVFERILTKRPIRTLSGVAVITALTKPYKCPGKCVFCPEEKFFPKSYLSGEPAAQRAKDSNFNPYLQVKKRLESLKKQGHPIDKIELIVLGGSFNYYPKKYQEWFITRCFAACNAKPTPNKNVKQTQKIRSLKEEQKINETAKCRIVGLTVETRPDLITEKEVVWLRKLGATKVETGAQIINDKILKRNFRGHSTKEIIEATKILKDAGFKVSYHLMLNLPGSNPQKDIESFKKAFENSDFKPDWLKIYPCVVCKGSKLYRIWKKGKYKPYADKQLINLLIKIKSQTLPYWVRVGRLFRDIPVPKIIAGCKISNLREVIKKEMKKRGLKCKCIRCREVKENYDPKEKIYLFRENYSASGGKEIFLSFENKTRAKLFAFLRLRIPSYIYLRGRIRISRGHEAERALFACLKNSTIVRELHTYGQMISLKKNGVAPQHKGLGKKLMAIAEKITKKELNLPAIAVISGIGVKPYYRKLGYKLKDTYMIKKL